MLEKFFIWLAHYSGQQTIFLWIYQKKSRFRQWLIVNNLLLINIISSYESSWCMWIMEPHEGLVITGLRRWFICELWSATTMSADQGSLPNCSVGGCHKGETSCRICSLDALESVEQVRTRQTVLDNHGRCSVPDKECGYWATGLSVAGNQPTVQTP